MEADHSVQIATWGGVRLYRRPATGGRVELELLYVKTSEPLTVRLGADRAWITLTPPDLDDPYDTSNQVYYGVFVEACTRETADRIEAVLRQLPLGVSPVDVGREGDGLHWCGEMRGERLVLTDTREWAKHRSSTRRVLREFGTGPALEIEALRRGLECVSDA